MIFGLKYEKKEDFVPERLDARAPRVFEIEDRARDANMTVNSLIYFYKMVLDI
jgi:hypothetical protein